jgi:hypothetical protein
MRPDRQEHCIGRVEQDEYKRDIEERVEEYRVISGEEAMREKFSVVQLQPV